MMREQQMERSSQAYSLESRALCFFVFSKGQGKRMIEKNVKQLQE